jgi:uroporphyrinogen-III synthase
LSIHNSPHRINVYQTIKPERADSEILERVKNDLYDLIVFTSPSTFHNFCSFYNTELLCTLKMGSIGAITTKAIQEAGFEPLFTARKSNAEGIRDAIIEYYQK